MGSPVDDHRHRRTAVTALALLLGITVDSAPAFADWRFTAAEIQGSAIFGSKHPGMTSLNFLRFEMGLGPVLLGTEAFGFRFQMEKQNENLIVTDSVSIWETLPLIATYVVYDWEAPEGITRGYRYLCLYGRVNPLLARTFDTDQQVRYGEGGVALYWNGPHQAPVVSLAVRAGYRLQHLGKSVQGEVTHESELEHQLLLGATVALDFWSSSFLKRRMWRKQTAKREREWQHYQE